MEKSSVDKKPSPAPDAKKKKVMGQMEKRSRYDNPAIAAIRG